MFNESFLFSIEHYLIQLNVVFIMRFVHRSKALAQSQVSENTVDQMVMSTQARSSPVTLVNWSDASPSELDGLEN